MTWGGAPLYEDSHHIFAGAARSFVGPILIEALERKKTPRSLERGAAIEPE